MEMSEDAGDLDPYFTRDSPQSCTPTELWSPGTPSSTNLLMGSQKTNTCFRPGGEKWAWRNFRSLPIENRPPKLYQNKSYHQPSFLHDYELEASSRNKLLCPKQQFVHRLHEFKVRHWFLESMKALKGGKYKLNQVFLACRIVGPINGPVWPEWTQRCKKLQMLQIYILCYFFSWC